VYDFDGKGGSSDKDKRKIKGKTIKNREQKAV